MNQPNITLRLSICATALAGVMSFLPVSAQPPALPEDLSGFHHINALVINDPENPLFGFHHFYVDDKGKVAMAQGGPYPAGSTFVGLVYKVASDGALINEGEGAAVTLMVKDPAAKDTGGWRFAQYTADGSLIEQDEASACFQCHTQVADRDYVFSQPLDSPLP